MAERLKTNEKTSLPLAINEVFDMVRSLHATLKILTDPKAIFLSAYPVGSIYMTVSGDENTVAKMTNKYGGTWVMWGAGRVPVGMGSNGSTNYSAIEATGGEEKHALTNSEMPVHSLTLSHHGDEGGSLVRQFSGVGGATSAVASIAAYRPPTSQVAGAYSYQSPTITWGSNVPHNVMQPYVTCYMWKRTA